MRREAIRRFLRRAVRDPGRGELGLYAANGAFYLFLSLGPLTALLLAAVPYTPLTEERVLGTLLSFAPEAFRRLLRAIVTDVYAHSAAALSLSLAAELWSGARFLAAVVRALGAICGGGRRGYLRRRAEGAAYTLLLLLFIVAELTLLLAGERLLLLIGARFPDAPRAWELVLRLRPLLVFPLLTVMNALLFRAGAGRRRLLCAAFSAAAWLVFSRLYSWALGRFGLFGVYGSIAVAAASLYWVYGSLYILFLGAWLSALEE